MVDGRGVTHSVSKTSEALANPGFLRLSASFAVHHSLLQRYLGLMQSDGLPLASFHRSLFNEQSLAADPMPLLSLSQLQRSWRQFLHGLCLPSSTPCEQCGVFPETLILDGTSLACRRTAFSPPAEHQPSSKPVQGLSFSDRVFIPSSSERAFVRKLAKGENVEWTVVRGPLGELLNRARRGSAVAEHFRPLLLELSASSAAAAVFPLRDDAARRSLRSVWRNESRPWEAGSEEEWARLAQAAPVLLRCLVVLHRGEGRVPSAVAKYLETRVNSLREALAACPDTGSLLSEAEPPADTGYFPFWKQVRRSRSYEADKKSRLRGDQCTKTFPSHGVLLPGILTCLCSHGKVYGAVLMERAESPRHVFQALLLHLPSPPKNIVYDFACALQNYCLAREPAFFASTRFLVDRFHQANHKACGGGQRLSEYTAVRELAKLNSEAAEQLNSRLRLLRRSLSYTNFADFKATLRLFLYLVNRRLS